MEEIQHLLFGGEEPARLSICFYRPRDFSELHVVPVVFDLSPNHLKKGVKGQNYTGLCPFHDEKNPGFVVRPKENGFCCYGCCERGGPFQLLALLTLIPLDYLKREFEFDFLRDRERLTEILRRESCVDRFDFNRYAQKFLVD